MIAQILNTLEKRRGQFGVDISALSRERKRKNQGYDEIAYDFYGL